MSRQNAALMNRCHSLEPKVRTWFLSRALENWLMLGGTFRRWYRICVAFVG